MFCIQANETAGFACYDKSKAPTSFISGFSHNFNTVDAWSRQSRFGEKVKDAKETSPQTILLKIFWLAEIRCTFISLRVLSL